MCKVGWGGTKCSVDVDECGAASSPCTSNNTVCVNSPGSYACECQTGYQKNDQDECVSK